MLSKWHIFGALEELDQYAPLALVELDASQDEALRTLRQELLACANAEGPAREVARHRLQIAFEDCQRQIPASLRSNPDDALGMLFALAEACCR